MSDGSTLKLCGIDTLVKFYLILPYLYPGVFKVQHIAVKINAALKIIQRAMLHNK